MIKKEYKKGDLTVIWEPGRCIHAGTCVHTLPEVFKPRERPWIQMDNADQKAIIDAVNACPSGAISVKTARPPDLMSIEPATEQSLRVSIITNGPAKVSGPCRVIMADGSVVEKPNGVSICRCGLSANKPFCDGTHKSNGFLG